MDVGTIGWMAKPEYGHGTGHRRRTRTRACRAATGFLLTVLAVLATACVPYRSQPERTSGREITPAAKAAIRPGVTSRSELLATLGPPDQAMPESRQVIYRWSKLEPVWKVFDLAALGLDALTVASAVANPINIINLFQPGVPVVHGIPFDRQHAVDYDLVVTFDDADRVERLELKSASREVAAAATVGPRGERPVRPDPECPAVDEAALNVAATSTAPPAWVATIAIATVAPLPPGGDKTGYFLRRPAGCWLRTGVAPDVLERALVRSLRLGAEPAHDGSASLELDVQVLSQGDDEDFRGFGKLTRKTELAIDYALVRGATKQPVWHEVITSRDEVRYGMNEPDRPAIPTGGHLVAEVCRIAHERAIRRNIETLIARLANLPVPE